MRKLFCIVCGVPLKWSYEFCSDECIKLHISAQIYLNLVKKEEGNDD